MLVHSRVGQLVDRMVDLMASLWVGKRESQMVEKTERCSVGSMVELLVVTKECPMVAMMVAKMAEMKVI